MNQGVGTQQFHMIHTKMQIALFFFSKFKMLRTNTENNFPSPGGREIVLGIRPEHFKLAEEKQGDLHLRVDHVELLGADTLVHGHFGEDRTSLTVRLADVQHFKKHTILPLTIPPNKLHAFDRESGRRIGN